MANPFQNKCENRNWKIENGKNERAKMRALGESANRRRRTSNCSPIRITLNPKSRKSHLINGRNQPGRRCGASNVGRHSKFQRLWFWKTKETPTCLETLLHRKNAQLWSKNLLIRRRNCKKSETRRYHIAAPRGKCSISISSDWSKR